MGAGGAGCSAAFAIAKAQGFAVSGCDVEPSSPYLDKKLSDLVKTGHDPTHLEHSDTVVYSPAITSLDEENEELSEARKKGLTVLPWDKFVAQELLKDKFVIAVAGTHGKGTVTAMIGVVLEKAGLNPTCLVGAVAVDWRKNYRIGKSKYFVIEADEYSEKFLNFVPNIAVITNIEFDHPEYFKDFEHLLQSFKKFVVNLPENSALITGPGVEIENKKGETIKVSEPLNLDLKMPGEFNKINAALASTTAKKIGIDEELITKSLENFKGVERRFEFVGEERGVLVFDDYAHHPTAIAKTLQTARDKFPDKKIRVVYEPHLYTRTKILFDDFVKSFSEAPVDEVIFVDIFAAREKNTVNISSRDLAKAVKGNKAKYIPSLDEVANYLAKTAVAGDVVFTIGAGDIYQLPRNTLNKLKETK